MPQLAQVASFRRSLAQAESFQCCFHQFSLSVLSSWLVYEGTNNTELTPIERVIAEMRQLGLIEAFMLLLLSH